MSAMRVKAYLSEQYCYLQLSGMPDAGVNHAGSRRKGFYEEEDYIRIDERDKEKLGYEPQDKGTGERAEK